MNSLIKNIFIYLLLLFLFGFVTRHISFKIDKNYSIKNNIDVLIIGASDTQNAIDDEVLKNSINLSDKGRHNLINYLILKKILKDNPQINKVIYGLSRNIVDSGIDKRWLDTRPKILTKILKYADFDDLINLIKYSPFLFSRVLLSAVVNLIDSPMNFGGYEGTDKNNIRKDEIYKINEDDFSRRSMQKIYVEKIIEYCKAKNIDLIFLRTPKHNNDGINNFNQSKGFFISFIKNFDEAKYVDFSEFFLEDSCYADKFHLNKRGARIFSNYLNSTGL